MSDLNSVLIVGRLTRDAEYRYTQDGKAIASFALAVNDWRKDAQGNAVVNYVDCNYFGKGAEAIRPYLTKGKQVGVLGQLRQDRWTDKQTGAARSKLVVAADRVQLFGGATQGQAAQYQALTAPQQAQQQAANDNFEDDIPF